MAAIPLDPELPGLLDALGDSIIDARSHDLAPQQIKQILELFQADGVPVSSAPPVLPKGGQLFIFDTRATVNYRSDGHEWHRPCGLPVDGAPDLEDSYSRHKKEGSNLRRHSYSLRGCPPGQPKWTLVHYLDTPPVPGSPRSPRGSVGAGAAPPTPDAAERLRGGLGSGTLVHGGVGHPVLALPCGGGSGGQLDGQLHVMSVWRTVEDDPSIPAVMVAQLLAGSPSFFLRPAPGRAASQSFLDLHRGWADANVAGVVALPSGDPALLAPLRGSLPRAGGQARELPVFGAWAVAPDAADYLVERVLRPRRLPLVLGLSPLLAGTTAADVTAAEAGVAARGGAATPRGQDALRLETLRLQEDGDALREFAEGPAGFKEIGAKDCDVTFEDAIGADGASVQRPVVRRGDGSVLTRIDPGDPGTSMLLRLRPKWEGLHKYLAGGATGGAAPYSVHVCTSRDRSYALEAWRQLDPKGQLIAPEDWLTRVVAGAAPAKELHAALQLPAPAQAGAGAMPLAVIIDATTDAWEGRSRGQVLLAPALAWPPPAEGPLLGQQLKRVSAAAFAAIGAYGAKAAALAGASLDLNQPEVDLLGKLGPAPSVAGILAAGAHLPEGSGDAPAPPSPRPAPPSPRATPRLEPCAGVKEVCGGDAGSAVAANLQALFEVARRSEASTVAATMKRLGLDPSPAKFKKDPRWIEAVPSLAKLAALKAEGGAKATGATAAGLEIAIRDAFGLKAGM